MMRGLPDLAPKCFKAEIVVICQCRGVELLNRLWFRLRLLVIGELSPALHHLRDLRVKALGMLHQSVNLRVLLLDDEIIRCSLLLPLLLRLRFLIRLLMMLYRRCNVECLNAGVALVNVRVL